MGKQKREGRERKKEEEEEEEGSALMGSKSVHRGNTGEKTTAIDEHREAVSAKAIGCLRHEYFHGHSALDIFRGAIIDATFSDFRSRVVFALSGPLSRRGFVSRDDASLCVGPRAREQVVRSRRRPAQPLATPRLVRPSG